MRTLRLLIPLCACCTALLLFVACQTTGSNVNRKSPEYAEGKALGKQMADEHRLSIVCSSKSRFQPAKGAKKYADLQRAQGKSEDFVKELFMFVKDGGENSDKESVIISLTGDIDLKQISKLTEKMDLPGGEHLEKANEKKS